MAVNELVIVFVHSSCVDNACLITSKDIIRRGNIFSAINAKARVHINLQGYILFLELFCFLEFQ